MRFVERLSQRQFAGLLAVLAAAGVVLVLAAPSQGSNFKIYSAVGEYFREFGSLPKAGQILDGGVSGAYADFPALNLWIYRLLLGYGTVSEAVWVTVQIGTVTVAAILLARWGQNTGLTSSTARWTGLTALFCIVVATVPLEDKAHYFWLPTLAFLTLSRNLWTGSFLLGLFAGWTGLAPLSVFLSAVRSGRSTSVRLLVTALSVAVALAAFLAAGPATATLLSNRAERESADAFWFSIWQFGGPLDSPLVRFLLPVFVALLALAAYVRGWTTLPAAVVVMSAGTLLASNNTVPLRLIMLLPLGVYLCASVRQQRLFLSGVVGWSSLVAISAVTDWAYYPAQSDVARGAQVIFINAPLLLMLVLWGKNLAWRRRHRPPEPLSPFDLQVSPPPAEKRWEELESGADNKD